MSLESLENDLQDVKIREIKNQKVMLILFGALLTVSIVFMSILMNKAESSRAIIEKQEHQIEILNLQIEKLELQLKLDSLHVLNWDNIDYWLEYFNVQHKDVVKQQIYLETSNLSSDICTDNHNLTGMKDPKVRPTVSLGVKRGHAYYGSYIDSLRDYAMWQKYSYKGGDYLHFLRNVGYATDPKYNSKLKQLNLS